MYKEDLVLNNQQWLRGYKTQPNSIWSPYGIIANILDFDIVSEFNL